MFGTLLHLLYSCDVMSLIFLLCFFIYFILFIVFYNKFRSNKIYIFFCFVPLIISFIHCVIFTFGSAFTSLFFNYIYIYIFSILIAFIPLFSKKKIVYNTSKVIIVLFFIFSCIEIISSGESMNFTRKNLSDSYIALCDYLEKNYIMNDWKKINYDKLKSDGLVLIKEAEQTGDLNKYYDALSNLVDSFHDGHMGLSFYNENDYFLEKIKSFNDYGLSLVTLDNGDTIAVDVVDGLDIKSGNVITKWNGLDIEKAINNVKLPIGEVLLDNEKIIKTFYLSGVGGDSIDVTYINSNNEEVTTKLNKLDSEILRGIKSFSTFNHTHDDELFDYKMLSDDIGYLKVGIEEIDEISDSVAYLTGNHTKAREKFRTYLRNLRSQGMKKLVIDIRNNKGGSDDVATALVSLFTKEKMYAFSLGYRSNGKNISLDNHYVLADGEFSDIPVVVLTNMRCGSAGDGLVLYFSRIDGINIAGLTNPGGINQETGGKIFMPLGAVISYPTGLVLDQDLNPNIDVDYTRVSRNPVDIKIPFDRDAALKIFSGVDYELEWAIDYLKK